MKRFFQTGWRRRLRWLAGLLIVGGLFFLLVFDRPASVEWLTESPLGRPARWSFLGAWAQPIRSVWRRVRSRVFSPPRSISLSADIFEFREALGRTSEPRPVATFTNGTELRVWLLSSNEWAVLSPAFLNASQRLSSPNIWTADGAPAQIVIGDTVMVQGGTQTAGLRLDVVPRARDRAIDLAVFLTRTEVVTNISSQSGERAATHRTVLHTNLALGVRLVVPQGKVAWLLSARAEDGRSTGLLLKPELPNSKK